MAEIVAIDKMGHELQADWDFCPHCGQKASTARLSPEKLAEKDLRKLLAQEGLGANIVRVGGEARVSLCRGRHYADMFDMIGAPAEAITDSFIFCDDVTEDAFDDSRVKEVARWAIVVHFTTATYFEGEDRDVRVHMPDISAMASEDFLQAIGAAKKLIVER